MTAKQIKIAASLAMVISIPGCGLASEMHHDIIMGIFVALFFSGLAGFVIGRFM